MLTEDETEIVAMAYALRHDESGVDLWFALRDDLLPEAHRLVERGYLDRRLHESEGRRRLLTGRRRRECDLVYRLSDEALTGIELGGLATAHEGRARGH